MFPSRYRRIAPGSRNGSHVASAGWMFQDCYRDVARPDNPRAPSRIDHFRPRDTHVSGILLGMSQPRGSRKAGESAAKKYEELTRAWLRRNRSRFLISEEDFKGAALVVTSLGEAPDEVTLADLAQLINDPKE